MVKYIQMIYGYCFVLSITYLIVKLLSLFLPITPVFYVTALMLSLFVFRVRPHPDSPNYPLAFDLQVPFLHRN